MATVGIWPGLFAPNAGGVYVTCGGGLRVCETFVGVNEVKVPGADPTVVAGLDVSLFSSMSTTSLIATVSSIE